MADLVKVRGDWHPEALANGLTMAPGEPFERSMIGDDDRRLIEEGIVIEATVTPTDEPMSIVRKRAQELDIPGRSTMSPDELREAVALAEADPTTAETRA